MFAGDFAPTGWMFCQGQLLSVTEYETLFKLIGTTYGGDGSRTFALPDLRGRVPISMGLPPLDSPGSTTSFAIGQTGGVEQVTLSTEEIPAHNHALQATTAAAGLFTDPHGQVLAQTKEIELYNSENPATPLSSLAMSSAGSSQPHTNIQPYLAINFIIALSGTVLTTGSDPNVVLESDSFMGEIRIFANDFAPRNWAYCDGQLLSILQYAELYSLIGTTYGGDGSSTFALPNLQGRVPLGVGQGPGLSEHNLGQTGGSQTVTLQLSEIPAHTHLLQASADRGDSGTPATLASANAYWPESSTTGIMSLASQALGSTGGGSAHDNMMPFLAVCFCICIFGLSPPRN